MITRLLGWRRFALTFSLAAVHFVDAQRPRPASDSLPREFVEALLGPTLGFYGGTTTNFVVGKIPPGLAPFLYVPPNARILGGIEAMSSTVAVFNVPMTIEEVRTTFQREQVKLGWASPTSESTRGWGFMQPAGVNPAAGLEFCHIGQSLQLNPTPGPNGTLNITARVQAYGSQCSSPARVGGRTPPPVEVPVLVNPMGTVMNPAECNAAIGGVFPGSSSERVQTRLAPAQMGDYFAQQLIDSGWTPTNGPAAFHRIWMHPDTAGAQREMTLMITPSSIAGCQDLSMQVRRVPKR